MLVRKEIGDHPGCHAVLVAQGDHVAHFSQALDRDRERHLVDRLLGQQVRQRGQRVHRVGPAKGHSRCAFSVAIDQCHQLQPVALGRVDVARKLGGARSAADDNDGSHCAGRPAQAAAKSLRQSSLDELQGDKVDEEQN